MCELSHWAAVGQAARQKEELSPALSGRAGNSQGPHDSMLGADRICFAIHMILYVLYPILRFYCDFIFQTYCSLYVCYREREIMRK